MYKKIEAQESSRTLQNCNNNVHIDINGEGLQKWHVLLTPAAAGHQDPRTYLPANSQDNQI